jgi:putative ABC transport system permease protein
MRDYIQAAFVGQRIAATFLTCLAGVALVLAAIGIYGVMAYVVSQRTQEIGIRMAMGAQVADVLKMILRQGASLGLLGVAIGLAGGLAVTRLLASFLYGVSPFDPWAFLSMAILLVAVTLLASVLPARRAAQVDPQIALRYE